MAEHMDPMMTEHMMPEMNKKRAMIKRRREHLAQMKKKMPAKKRGH